MSYNDSLYRNRLAEEEMERALRSFGAVCIVGPKWCGKTWMGIHGSKSQYILGEVNEFGVSKKDLAQSNIRIAMDGEEPHLIDEWQEVPQLWDAIRSDIDSRGVKGAYILTGSATPKVKKSKGEKKPVHSGTGRIVRVHMYTMSLYESGDSTGSISLKSLMESESIKPINEGTDLDHLIDLVISGGWPGVLDLEQDDRAYAVRGYLESVIKDACNLDDVRRKESVFWLIVRSLARNECTLASLSKIHNDTGVPLERNGPLMLEGLESDLKPPMSYDTVTDYVDVLDRLYLIEDQPAFDLNLRSSVRVGKTSKRHLTDPSLAIAALNVGKERLKNDLTTFGFFFESMCERDLRIYAHSIDAELFHYRDSSGMEVDAIIEMKDGTWGAFEIKLGANRIEEAAENLLKFRNMLEKRGASRMPSVLCVICGLTQYAYRRDDGVYVVPITSLRP
ncbi:MAG: ATP-binding protein [Candidatus Methanomethylophilaceae archaeon]